MRPSIITRYVLKEHIGPFLFALATIVFVFILNIVFRDLGKLLGKGISALVILEFFFLNIAWILALAIPMAVLIGTLMSFGRLSADNEITALKASGVNLYRMIFPVLIAACILCVLMERFNNCVLPDFNHRVKVLYSDISKKRPTLTLEPHVFFNDVNDLSILVHKIEKEDSLREVIIYDTSDPELSKTIFAESGHLKIEGERMVLTLYDGEVHEIDNRNYENYRRLKFEKQVISHDIPNLELKRSNTQHRGDREKSAGMMRADIAVNRETIQKREQRIRSFVASDMKKVLPGSIWKVNDDSTAAIVSSAALARKYSIHDIRSRAKRAYQQVQSENRVIEGSMKSIRRKQVEIHKKYAIPVACIVFVLIGAPLGILARRSGLATGWGMSLLFFMIYWIFLIGGEQLADRGIISTFVAMWFPNVLVGFAGILLVVRTVREMTEIPWERWGRFFKNLVRKKA